MAEKVSEDPRDLSDEQIAAELAELAGKLAEAWGSGARIGELEARRWRLRAEQTFRHEARDEFS